IVIQRRVIKKAAAPGALLQYRQVAGVTGRLCQRHDALQRFGQLAHRLGQAVELFVTGLVEDETGDHLVAGEAVGKALVVFEFGGDFFPGTLVCGAITQLAFGEGAHGGNTLVAVRLGKHHVEAQCLDLVVIKEYIDQVGQYAAVPRPVADLGKTLFVDVGDDNTVIDAARCGHAQARVVGRIFQGVDEGKADKVRAVKNEGGADHGDQQVA